MRFICRFINRLIATENLNHHEGVLFPNMGKCLDYRDVVLASCIAGRCLEKWQNFFYNIESLHKTKYRIEEKLFWNVVMWKYFLALTLTLVYTYFPYFFPFFKSFSPNTSSHFHNVLEHNVHVPISYIVIRFTFNSSYTYFAIIYFRSLESTLHHLCQKASTRHYYVNVV